MNLRMLGDGIGVTRSSKGGIFASAKSITDSGTISTQDGMRGLREITDHEENRKGLRHASRRRLAWD